jgi:hypothetical protein
LWVALVAVGGARAELPHLVARLAADAERALPMPMAPASEAVPGRGRRTATRLGVTGAAMVPPLPTDVAAVARVQGMAVRALQPSVVVQSAVVHSVKVTPMWPLGACVTFEFVVPFRR